MKTVLGTLVVSVVVALLTGLGVMYIGVFDVSTRWQDPPLWHWVLATTREESIERRSGGIEAPDLTDRAMIARGFQSYRDMCAGCHGKPGGERSPLAQGLNPPPPDLSDLSPDEPAGELFWIIKNGVRMTGMPGWGATHSDAALWDIVAFVKTLPGMTPAAYSALESTLPAGHHHSHHEHEEHAGNSASHSLMEEQHTH